MDFKNSNNKLLERTFSCSINKIKQEYDSDEECNKYGEITGGAMMEDKFNKGLPMRSQYFNKKKTNNGDDENSYNLAFNYNKKLKNLQYNDRNVENYADINMGMKPLTHQINPTYITNIGLEKLGSLCYLTIMENENNNNTNIIINNYGLYSIFSALHCISKEITYNDTKKFFDFPDKKLLRDSMLKLKKNINISNHIKTENFLIYGNNIPFNNNNLSKISDMCEIIRVNIKDAKNEAEKMSYVVNTFMNTNLKNPVTQQNIENLQVMFMITSVIHPVWTIAFDKIIIFNNRHYLYSKNRKTKYYENSDLTMIELECFDGSICFGFINNMKKKVILDNTKIHNYIDNMKEIVLGETVIPAIKTDLKIRYNNILKKTGLKSVFHKITTDEVFLEGDVVLHDVIQNVKIIIDNDNINKNNENNENSEIKTTKKFILEDKFEFYVRVKKTNTIIYNGYMYNI